MQTIETKVYDFNELSAEVQSKVIEKQRQSMYENGQPLWDFSDYCHEKAQEKGFKDIKIQYSLSNSQGDGLSFSAEIDKETFINECLPGIKTSVYDIICNYVHFKVKGNSGRYYYASKNDIEVETEFYKNTPNLDKLIDILYNHIADTYLTLCNELEKYGYDAIDYYYSDENVKETILANDYKYTINGQLFNF
jgi:hypothetical protein